MFSGIVEECATLVAMVRDQENVHFTFKCSFVSELKIDQSISHNGVCLTVVSMTDDTYTVTAMKETLDRSNLGLLGVGDEVNVERSMMMNGRLDGHIVQGHVDQTATCVDIKDAEGSYYFTFRYEFDKEMAKRGYITVDKGSVTVNGRTFSLPLAKTMGKGAFFAPLEILLPPVILQEKRPLSHPFPTRRDSLPAPHFTTGICGSTEHHFSAGCLTASGKSRAFSPNRCLSEKCL